MEAFCSFLWNTFVKIFLEIIRHLFPKKHAALLGVKFGKNCRFIKVNFGTEPYLIKIGNRVSITYTKFITHDGAIWIFRDRFPKIDLIKPITIGSNVFIGAGCIILPGANIGDNVIIGAGSVISGNVTSGTVVAGTPAKKVCSTDEYYQKNRDTFLETKHLNAVKKQEFLRGYFDK